jgi:hypothetical protein
MSTVVVEDSRCSRALMVRTTTGWLPTLGMAGSHTSPRSGSERSVIRQLEGERSGRALTASPYKAALTSLSGARSPT